MDRRQALHAALDPLGLTPVQHARAMHALESHSSGAVLPDLRLRPGDLLVIHCPTPRKQEHGRHLIGAFHHDFDPLCESAGARLVIVFSLPPVESIDRAAAQSTTGIVPRRFEFQIIRPS